MRWANLILPSPQHPAPEREERQEEGAGRKRDRQAEHDLDQSAEATGGVAECERETGHDDDDHGENLGDRTLDRLQDLVERLLPGPVRTRSPAGSAEQRLETGRSGQHRTALKVETRWCHG